MNTASDTLTLGSLFDGSGGFPLAGTLCGITPIWAAEVEPYPVAVTKSRFPSMQHLGSVTDIDGGKVPAVDIITFGSPCQDMSVAGKRSGIEGSRSNLFFEAIRIIKEMRKATNNEYPKYIIWENVPGAFSSNNGHDFHTVLTEICSACDSAVSIPRPYDPKRPYKLLWNGAGQIMGNGYSLAWRTFDAQYWGVPQRRKRIYLVADFTGQRAGEILFERNGLRGNLSKGNETGQSATADAVGGVDGTIDANYYKGTGMRQGVEREVIAHSAVCVLNDQGGLSINVESEEISPTLRANSHQHEPVIALQAKQQSMATTEECANTLGSNDWKEPQVIALQANGIDRADTAGCNGCGWRENESYTLNTIDRHAVCYENHQHGGYREGCGTLWASGGDYGGGSENLACYDARGNGEGDIVPTLTGDHQNRITDYTAVVVQETKGEKECVYGAKTETNTDKILQALWEEVGAKKVAEWGFRILNSFQQKGVLRPCLHGKSVSEGGNGVNKVDSPAPNEPQEKAERELRGVWSEKCARCTPQRWKPSEQQLGEFTAHLQELSQQDSSAEGVLHHMWETNERAWLLRKALSEIQKAREPICNKNQPIQRRYIIRRLLPVECARLQGFPDFWGRLAPYNPADAEFWEQVRKTYAEIYGKVYKPCKNLEAWYNKLHTDSAEYKMWGNGIALPNALYVLEGITIHNNYIAV